MPARHTAVGYSRYFRCLSSWTASLCFSLLVGSPVHAATSLSISDGGTPSYALPIAVPPGISGMAPNISLLYSPICIW